MIGDLLKLIKKYHLDYFFVFLTSLFLFAWLQGAPALPEPDSFYHAKMAAILSEGNVLHQFPWLKETNLASNFVDHHFLYHLLMAPLVKVFSPLMAAKLFTVLIDVLLVMAIFWLFKKFEVKYPVAFIIFLLVSAPWLFRASLVKAPMLFLVLLILAFYFTVYRKWFGLFLISFFSVWLYAGWPLILVAVLIYFLVYWLLEKLRIQDSIWYKVKNLFNAKKYKTPWQALLYTVLGLVAGLVVNPYFPANLKFYWLQIYNIALVNYQKVIGVGGEWYPYGFLNLVNDAPLIMAALIVSLLLFILTFKKVSIYSWTWGLLTLAFLFLTLKSKRNVEFFIPLAVIFSAFIFSDYFKKLSKLHLKILSHLGWQIISIIIIAVFGLGFVFQIPADLTKTKKQIIAGWPLDHYKEAAVWLKNNTPQDSIVFNADWDDFPFLFYFNSHNYYLTGLDPTFMYKKNPDRYWQYVNVTLGQEYLNLKNIVKGEFGADYVFLDKLHNNLNRNLRYSNDFVKVYEDNEAIIYKVINNA